MKIRFKLLALFSAVALAAFPLFSGCSKTEETVVLRVANWEEYIDLGGWEEDEIIDINNPYAPENGGIFGDKAMTDEFVEWFNAQDYGFNVSVQYSTFGTNEDLYNRLNLGDTYDLVCPSDYMMMKLIDEGKVEKFSESFKDPQIEGNYYAQNVSRYIDVAEDSIFYSYDWQDYAACYMWGTTGFAYNPEKIVDVQDFATWNVLLNEDYNRKITIKDNVRDSYFAALAIKNSSSLLSENYTLEQLSDILNDTQTETINEAQDILKKIKENVYSFEVDSGKADMVTGKVYGNFQWSGDAVYILDEAEADEENALELWYSVPEECANLWFDGWIMLKDGINGNEQRKTAAEAFVNYLSRPDNAVRNMYYIGYTSAIASDLVFDYMDWNYGYDFESQELSESLYLYDLSYFFGEGKNLYVDAASLEITDALSADKTIEGISYEVLSGGKISRGRQLFAQYPTESVINRSVVMLDFGDKLAEINQMWINVRCQDLLDVSPASVIVTAVIILLIVGFILVYKFRYQIFKPRVKKGFKKVN
ncbi:MAG: ABC transporter substrate-binding protein [Clostridia bacterium]|nr:ABC transporter substrate-binding protein [Clostridia bacterium]